MSVKAAAGNLAGGAMRIFNFAAFTALAAVVLSVQFHNAHAENNPSAENRRFYEVSIECENSNGKVTVIRFEKNKLGAIRRPEVQYVNELAQFVSVGLSLRGEPIIKVLRVDLRDEKDIDVRALAEAYAKNVSERKLAYCDGSEAQKAAIRAEWSANKALISRARGTSSGSGVR